MAKRTKKAAEAPKPEPLVVTQMRVASVDTKHGTFLRFMWLQTTDGEVTDKQFLNNYFDDPQACQIVIQGMIEAMQLPVLHVTTIETKH